MITTVGLGTKIVSDIHSKWSIDTCVLIKKDEKCLYLGNIVTRDYAKNK